MATSKVIFTEEVVKIPTYQEGKTENLPMFAENRVHQRTSGNPFPNKVVLETYREERIEEEYTLLKLENEFIELAIMPKLGGKIWYAKDKRTGYHFIYKNNVVKPALIGVLGSWTSGGLEFNWPFHHRASTFMPVDYEVEQGEDYVTVWLSEHDPIDRMKGMVGVCLKAGECIFETKVKLDNLSDTRRSFLWWENTAVPVNKNYELFFPEDVNYVRFHYKRSVTTYPIANNDKFGAYNGIYYNGDTDISKHKNTDAATSYFSAESAYDYFGGYDHGKKGGIVHIADHHISPGKKMFTWGYNQLSRVWENALTDDDGAYAELMAGCYSDNQPDFSWIFPNETKTFSQKWYPIHDLGTPIFANDDLALFHEGGLHVQAVRAVKNAKVLLYKMKGGMVELNLDLPCYDVVRLGDELAKGDRIQIIVGNRQYADYTFGVTKEREIPQPRKEYPYFKEVESASELYKLALHTEQYRSPEYSAEECYLECLKRDNKFTPALVALAEINYRKFEFAKALDYANQAEEIATEYNTRLENGRLYYTKALILSALDKKNCAYDYFYKAAFVYDYKCVSMLRLGLLDIANGDYFRAEEHLQESLNGNAKSVVASAHAAYVTYLKGDKEKAIAKLQACLEGDKLNLFARAFLAVLTEDYKTFVDGIHTDLSQNLMDIFAYWAESGLTEEICKLVKGVSEYTTLTAMPRYLADVLAGRVADEYANEGIAFPSRVIEWKTLKEVCTQSKTDFSANFFLGTLLYGRGAYADGNEYMQKAYAIKKDYRICRNLAVVAYSREQDFAKAKAYMEEALKLMPSDEKQMVFEYVYLLAKIGEKPESVIAIIKEKGIYRDDIVVELARAYNHLGQPEKALKALHDRAFVACEGGEHYIADQYMYAHYLQGRKLYEEGKYEEAANEFCVATEIPNSLGAGLWNPVKKVPFRYFQAMSYDKLGDREKAEEILKGYLHFRYDYFTNMYLYTYAYYDARALEYLGQTKDATELMQNFLASDEKELTKTDMGHFGTTPFFISFIDRPATARENYFAYRLFLTSKFLGDKERMEKYSKIVETDGYGMYIEDFTK